MSNLVSLKPKSGALLCAMLAVAGTWVVGCGDEEGGSGATGGAGGKGGSASGGTAGKGTGGGSGGSGGTAKGGSSGKGGSAGSSGEAGSPPGAGGSGDAGAGGSGDAGSSGDAGAGGAMSSCDVVVPTGYDGANFYTSTGKGTAIDALVLGMASLMSGTAMSLGVMTLSEKPITTDPAPVPATAAAMATAFNTGTPTTAFAASTTAFQELAAAMFVEHEAASLATWDGTPALWDTVTAPAGEGGVLHNMAATSGRIYNERGLEPRQVVDKGSYSAVFYSHARAVALAGPITAATIDVIARALGVENPAMPIAPMTLPAGTYVRTANYAHQVGLLAPLKNALIRAQAYAGNSDCSAELQTAITDIFTGWERAAMARASHYAYQARTKVQNGDADIFVTNDALHQLAEGMGLAIGWRGVSGKIISESQLDTLADGFLIPGLPVMTNVVTHWLLNNSAQELDDALPRLDAAVLQIQTVYGFTTDQMNNFKLATPVPG